MDMQRSPGAGAVILLALMISLMAACDDFTLDDLTQPTMRPGSEITSILVGPELVDCVGVAPRKCLVVDGELFYENIEGFTHEEGYMHSLRVERYLAFGEEPPPEDASKYAYILIEVMDKYKYQE